MPARSTVPLTMFGTRLPTATLRRLQLAAGQTGVPQSVIVTRALEHWLQGGKVADLPKANVS